MPSHSVNTKMTYDRIQLRGFHLFCSGNLASITICKCNVHAVSCWSWMGLGATFACSLAQRIKGCSNHWILYLDSAHLFFKSSSHTSRGLLTFRVSYKQSDLKHFILILICNITPILCNKSSNHLCFTYFSFLKL